MTPPTCLHLYPSRRNGNWVPDEAARKRSTPGRHAGVSIPSVAVTTPDATLVEDLVMARDLVE
jgi:hypothetical protein